MKKRAKSLSVSHHRILLVLLAIVLDLYPRFPCISLTLFLYCRSPQECWRNPGNFSSVDSTTVRPFCPSPVLHFLPFISLKKNFFLPTVRFLSVFSSAKIGQNVAKKSYTVQEKYGSRFVIFLSQNLLISITIISLESCFNGLVSSAMARPCIRTHLARDRRIKIATKNPGCVALPPGSSRACRVDHGTPHCGVVRCYCQTRRVAELFARPAQGAWG